MEVTDTTGHGFIVTQFRLTPRGGHSTVVRVATIHESDRRAMTTYAHRIGLEDTGPNGSEVLAPSIEGYIPSIVVARLPAPQYDETALTDLHTAARAEVEAAMADRTHPLAALFA